MSAGKRTATCRRPASASRPWPTPPTGRRSPSGIMTAPLCSGTKVASLAGHQKAVLVTTFSPDGKTLVTAGLDGTLKIWNLETLSERAAPRWHTGYVFSAAFTPDGRTLAVGGGSRVGSFMNG